MSSKKSKLLSSRGSNLLTCSLWLQIASEDRYTPKINIQVTKHFNFRFQIFLLLRTCLKKRCLTEKLQFEALKPAGKRSSELHV